jgi:hypothetical protein
VTHTRNAHTENTAMSYATPEELALVKSLPVRPWAEPPARTVPAGHANRRAVRAASKRLARKTKREQKAR